jgi:uncharacterized protein YgbK (DUF1537 family)
LITAGSLTPQTVAQVEQFKQTNQETFSLHAENLFDEIRREIYLLQTVQTLSEVINSGKDVVFHSENRPEKVALTRQLGYARGFSLVQVSRLISGTLAGITQQVVINTGQRGLIVAGGETSAAVCLKLNLFGFRVAREIEAGLPSCISLSDPQFILVLKSGSFGKVDFFQKALNHLRDL